MLDSVIFGTTYFVINSKWIVAKVKSTLRDQYVQKWHANIDSFSKGVTYKNFKMIFCLEKYLLLLQPKQWKTIINRIYV